MIAWGMMLIMVTDHFWKRDSENDLNIIRQGLILCLVSRGLGGIVAGGFSSLVPLSLVEISPVLLTGFFGSLNQFAISFGIALCYLFGAGGWHTEPDATGTGLEADVYHFSWIAIIAMGICLLEGVLIWFVPEAERVQFGESVIVNPQNEGVCNERHCSSLRFVCLMSVFQQLSGVSALLINAQLLFEHAHVSGLGSRWPSVIFGAGQVLACGVTTALVQSCARRVLWMISSLFVAAADTGYAVYWMLKPGTPSRGIFMLVLVFLHLTGYGLGLGALPWLLAAEVFLPTVRTKGMALHAATNWLSAAVVITMFPQIAGMEQRPDAESKNFWPSLFFAVCSVCGFVYGRHYIGQQEDREGTGAATPYGVYGARASP
jgi:hypothetical protein